MDPPAAGLLAEKAWIGKGLPSEMADGELPPWCQGGGTLAIPLDRIVTVSGSGEPGKAKQQRPL
jgi:hypothetical protein